MVEYFEDIFSLANQSSDVISTVVDQITHVFPMEIKAALDNPLQEIILGMLFSI